MTKDRFLIGILIGISAMVLAALILFFVRQGRFDYMDESTPKGVLHNYVLSIQWHDYQRAYGYLAENTKKPAYEEFLQTFQSYQANEIADTAVEIGYAAPDEPAQTVRIPMSIIRGGQEPFSEIHRSQETAILTRADGAWKITQAPFPYWGYSWELPPSGSPYYPAPANTP